MQRNKRARSDLDQDLATTSYPYHHYAHPNQHQQPLPDPAPPLSDPLFPNSSSTSKPTPGPSAGRRRVPYTYIEDRTRRHITFSKRKAGLIKKANELACLTGTEIMLLVASEAGTVYFHTTDRFRPLVDSPAARQRISECLIAGRPRGPCTVHTPPFNEALDSDNHALNLGPPLSNSGRPLVCKFVRMIPPETPTAPLHHPFNPQQPFDDTPEPVVDDVGRIMSTPACLTDPMHHPIVDTQPAVPGQPLAFTGYPSSFPAPGVSPIQFPPGIPFQVQPSTQQQFNAQGQQASWMLPRLDSKLFLDPSPSRTHHASSAAATPSSSNLFQYQSVPSPLDSILALPCSSSTTNFNQQCISSAAYVQPHASLVPSTGPNVYFNKPAARQPRRHPAMSWPASGNVFPSQPLFPSTSTYQFATYPPAGHAISNDKHGTALDRILGDEHASSLIPCDQAMHLALVSSSMAVAHQGAIPTSLVVTSPQIPSTANHPDSSRYRGDRPL